MGVRGRIGQLGKQGTNSLSEPALGEHLRNLGPRAQIQERAPRVWQETDGCWDVVPVSTYPLG